MSTIKMQESTFNEEVVQLRRQAASKDNCYATLENELLKKNNDLLAVKQMLNETLFKLRQEADRALKLESDLNRQAEDLRSERLRRHNIEASLKATNEKLASEEKAAKYIQMELDTYASRMSSHHEQELKRLQHEKSTLEARVRTLESQSQSHANKPPQPPTRLPRPTTFSGAASTVSEARIATLESDLSKARLELADASRSLATAQQDAAKLPRLQSDLIAADNARLRAEKVANTETANTEDTKELLKEREEELEYWRSTAAERSVDGGRLEDALKEHDEAVRSEAEARRSEIVLRKRIQDLEESEAELVMQREEALNELHRLQVESPVDSRAANSTITELRSALAERESALLTARGYATELQQIYRETLRSCEDAEARVRDLELQLHPAKHDPPPLVIVSPPASPSAPTPFLAQPKPMTRMSPEDEAVVARLLTAIERLRGERDALRRDLHFAKVEHRMEDDALRARLDATEHEVRRLEKIVAVSQEFTDQQHSEGRDELRRVHEELKAWHDRFERKDAELTDRNADLASNIIEMNRMRVRVREVEESRERLIASYKDSSRIAITSLIAIQHLGSELDQAEDRLSEIYQTSDDASVTNRTLRSELATTNTRFAGKVKEVERRDAQISDMDSKLSEFQIQVSSLERELSEAREELNATEMRYRTQQLSGLSSQDGGGAEGMESQLEVLEARILRRNEQIKMLQHDTKRLETNLRVAEETIGELTAELETLGQERACLVDDSAQAREARDDALRKVEELEVEHAEELLVLRCRLDESIDEADSLRLQTQTATKTIEDFESLELDLRRLKSEHAEELLVLRSRLDESIGQADSLRLQSQAATKPIEDLESLEVDLRRLKSEHAEELLVLRSRLDESIGQADSLRLQIQTMKETIEDLESEIEMSAARYDASQVEIHRLEQTLAAARAQVDEHDASIEALQREKTALQIEQTRLEAELDRSATKHQYAEQQAKRSEHAYKDLSRIAMTSVIGIQHFGSELNQAEDRLSEISQTSDEATASHNLIELDLHRLKSEHAEELLVLRSRLDESIGQADSLRLQIQTATKTIEDLGSEIEMSAGRYDAAQVEIHDLGQALAAARAHVDEHDASIEALQHEKTVLQIEQTRLEAELDRLATKHQSAEQQAKRSDHEVMRLKPEVDRLRGEVAKLDEAAQAAEISLSFKTNQYEQKLAMMQRELLKQQSHSQCQEAIAELNEKIEYLEEILKMKSVEIEENDDRFIEALKEKKRLTSKVDSLTRKVGSLQTKMAALTAAPPSASSPPLPVARPKTPSPPMPLMPSAGTSSHTPTRIPSSPGVALRSKTPEPSRSTVISKIPNPEPPVPPLPNITYKTPDQPRPASRVDAHRLAEAPYSSSRVQSASPAPLPSGNRKRRAPDDFDSPAPGPVEAIVASIDNTPPRHFRRPTNDGRSGFTPSRSTVTQRPMVPQPSPLRRSVTPLAEATNSPRGNRPIGLGKPASVSKPPMRSWLSRTRGVSNVSADTRSTSVLGVRP